MGSIFLRGTTVAVGFLAASLFAEPSPAESAAARLVEAHVTFLADDLLEGRAAGTRGYDLAAHYVATEFRKIGLAPGGPGNGYLQPVALLESKRDYAGARFALRSAGDADVQLEALNDFIAAPSGGRTAVDVTAPAVFVGYGVHAPQQNYSDLNGADLQGKIAVVFFGAPATLPGTERAHFSNAHTKAEELARRGAIGMITVNTPAEDKRRPWATTLASVRFPSMSLVGADGAVVDVVPAMQVTASMSPRGTGKLFARLARPFAELVAAAERSEPQHAALGVTVSIQAQSVQQPVSSHNVLGILPGSDPARARDYLVITSHLDHLGIGTAVDGDAIYNGAIDNAIGVASLLAAANHLATGGVRLRRPILFAAVTAEEKGLLGARHLSRTPPTGGRYVANLNVDAGPFFAPLRAAIGMGREHTTMGAVFAAVTQRLNWAVRPDPRPEERRFVRSDQYSFVREGVPALRVLAAAESTDPAINLTEIDRLFWRDRYHKPNDDLKHPIHFASAGAFAVLLAEVARVVADDERDPAWLPGDFFGERFGRK